MFNGIYYVQATHPSSNHIMQENPEGIPLLRHQRSSICMFENSMVALLQGKTWPGGEGETLTNTGDDLIKVMFGELYQWKCVIQNVSSKTGNKPDNKLGEEL